MPGTDLAPQAGNDHFDGIGIHFRIALIDPFDEFAAVDHHFLAQDEAGEDPPLQRGQLQRQAVMFEGSELGIEDERTAGDGGGGVAGGAANECTQPQHQFFYLERLGEKIVCSSFETRHLVRPSVTRGQNEHGQVPLRRPP
ncbi:hypothetical protein D3C80_1396890 [compost metagenome]